MLSDVNPILSLIAIVYEESVKNGWCEWDDEARCEIIKVYWQRLSD
jgi:hypothetical protein